MIKSDSFSRCRFYCICGTLILMTLFRGQTASGQVKHGILISTTAITRYYDQINHQISDADLTGLTHSAREIDVKAASGMSFNQKRNPATGKPN